jgi:hypothetical protein
LVKIGELRPKEMALTPRGHQVMVLKQGEKTTEVEVVKTGKKMNIPNSQMVKRASLN